MVHESRSKQNWVVKAPANSLKVKAPLLRLVAVTSPETARVCDSQYLQTKTISDVYIMDRGAVLAHI